MHFIRKLLTVTVTLQICFSQKLEIKNLHEDPILLLKFKSCKIQTGVIKIIHPINLTNLEITINSISRIVKNKLDDKLELNKIIQHKYTELVNNFHQIVPKQRLRHKRWDTLGSAWKWMAGTPDAEDLRLINGTMNELINANNQQFHVNEQINRRIEIITNTVNRAMQNTTIANTVILTEIDMIATIINIDTVNTILEDIQDTIIKTKIELASNRILTLTEILKIKDLLVNQGINVTLPDEALQYVTPKIAINKDTLLYILQVPKMEEEDSVILTIIPLVVNNTIIPNYPRHLIKSKQKVFTTLNHKTFVQKHSDIKEFQDNCIRPLVMGTRSQCNVTSETQTTVQYIAEDKLLLINAKNETLYSNCGPNNRELTGNFLVDFFNCTLTFRDKKFHSYEVETEMQVVQGAMHNVQATRQLIASLSVDVLNQENIENRKRLTHVYLRQADHQNWMLTLSGGISVSSISIIILIVYIRIAQRSSTINIKESSKTSSPTSTTLPSTSHSDVLSKYGILPKAEDALSPPPGEVTRAR